MLKDVHNVRRYFSEVETSDVEFKEISRKAWEEHSNYIYLDVSRRITEEGKTFLTQTNYK